jgi:3-oxoacyl-[acyl-carrier protein] reductase
MPGTLAGKTAVVTGSSKGIGYAIAEALAREDANVVVSARDAAEVQLAAERLDRLGAGNVAAVPGDMRKYDDVRALIAAALDLGGLDVLVNNAGVGGFAPVDQLSVEQWDAIIGTNLTGVFYACREAVGGSSTSARWRARTRSRAAPRTTPASSACWDSARR